MWWDYAIPVLVALAALAFLIFLFPRWKGGL